MWQQDAKKAITQVRWVSSSKEDLLLEIVSKWVLKALFEFMVEIIYYAHVSEFC